MKFYFSKSISATILVFFVINSTTTSPLPFRQRNPWLLESKLTIQAVEKGLKYFTDRPEGITDDVILGVLIAKANIEWIKGRLRLSSNNSLPWSRALEGLVGQCEDIIELHEPKNHPLLDKRLWKNEAGALKYGALHLHEDDFRLPKFDSCQSIDEYMMRGTPRDSDFCLNELINSWCQVSDNCWDSEVNGAFHSGYKTTHRLLYFQSALKVNCEKVNKKFSGIPTITKKLCQQILVEARALFREPHFPLTQDLFMEQIALCGLEGYEEFAPKIWRDGIRSWQTREGCFGRELALTNCLFNASDASSDKKKQKRRDTVIADCHTHVTAVGLSAMAFFLRFLLKVAFDVSSEF